MPEAPAAAAGARRLRDVAILAAACGAAGFASILAGQDANWDLRNYHLYNPWAWLNGRYGFDLAPAQLQTFHNALLDVPLHAMVAADWPPRLIAFVLALPAGVAAFFVWRIARLLLRDVDRSTRRVAIATALAIGLTGVNGISMLGSTMNEWPGAALAMAALWLLLRDEVDGGAALRTVAIAGFLVGLATGLKFTAATFAVGLAAALSFRRPTARALGQTLAFAACVLAGIAVTAGPWMAMLERHYGSPLFPYFNAWLGSPLLPSEFVLDRRFGPKAWQQWLTLPFAVMRPPAMYVGELPYRDARITAVVVLALVAIVARLSGRRANGMHDASGDAGTPRAWRFAGVFFVASFLVWAMVHAIYRYLLPLELVSGVAVAFLVVSIAPARARVPSLVAVALLVVATTRYPDWGRTKFGKHWLDVQRPPIEENALVLLTSDAPMAYVLTRFPSGARHVGIASNILRPDRPTGLRALADSMIDTHRGPIYQLTVPEAPAERALASFGVERSAQACGEVRTNLAPDVLLLCPLRRIGAG